MWPKVGKKELRSLRSVLRTHPGPLSTTSSVLSTGPSFVCSTLVLMVLVQLGDVWVVTGWLRPLNTPPNKPPPCPPNSVMDLDDVEEEEEEEAETEDDENVNGG